MRRGILFIFLLLPAPAFAGSLENDLLRVDVSPENGSITKILDKRNQTEYVVDPARARLFRLLLPRRDYPVRRINSWDQQVSSIETQGQTLRIRFKNLQIARQSYVYQVGMFEVPEPHLDIDVLVDFSLEGDHLTCNIQIENHSLEEITDVTFPWIGGVSLTSAQQPAKLVLPTLDGPYRQTSGFVLGDRAKRYPAVLATSWLNFEYAGKGLGLEVRSEPETQDAYFSLGPSAFPPGSVYWTPPEFPFIAWNFYPHISGQSRWRSPEVIIHVHDSDWHTVAAEHREWYRQHCAPIRSSALDHTSGFATYRLKREDDTVDWKYDDIPKLAEEARLAGMHDLVIDGWREHEGPGNPCPFGEVADPRMGGGARLKALIEKLHQQGIELAFSFHPTLFNSTAEQYPKEADQWSVKTRRQAYQIPVAATYVTADYPYDTQYLHYWAEIDPASPATEFLLREAKRLHDEYGFRNLFLEGVGQRSFLSYNQNDALPPQKVYEVGYKRLLGGLRELFPEGLLLMEGFNDLVNQYGSGGYTWSQIENAEVLAYSLPWIPFSNDVEALDYDKANASFARKILINLIVDGGRGTVGRYPEFAQHLKALAALKEAAGPYYAQAEFRGHEGLKKLDPGAEVAVSVFSNTATGQTGLVLASLGNQPREVSLALDLRGKRSKGHLYRLSHEQKEIELTPNLTVGLAAYEVAILGIEPE
jgi:hypothetical protein